MCNLYLILIVTHPYDNIPGMMPSPVIDAARVKMARTSIVLSILLTLLSIVIAEHPLVTLDHGGQLRGKRFDYSGVNIDLFLGELSYFL